MINSNEIILKLKEIKPIYEKGMKLIEFLVHLQK